MTFLIHALLDTHGYKKRKNRTKQKSTLRTKTRERQKNREIIFDVCEAQQS